MNQYNKVSGKAYEGNNQSLLQTVKEKNGYQSDEWVTFLQAREIGLKVKKGSKGVSVFKGFMSTTKKDENGKVKTGNAPLGFATVFNLDCCEAREKLNN